MDMNFHSKQSAALHSRILNGRWIGYLMIVSGIFAGPLPTSLIAAEEEQPQQLLNDVVQDMSVATRWLSKMATDVLTQETQKDAVEKLDKLIVELEKQAQANDGSMSSANPSRPMADSRIKSGPGGLGKLHAADQDGKHWAELPAHERERILQSMTEGFPAHYQGILEAYFKRIAEEKPLNADDHAPGTNGSSDGSSGSRSNSGAADVSVPVAAPPAESSGEVGTKSSASK
jgi:hypothetical protein